MARDQRVSCGCINRVDATCGVLHCVKKCPRHQRLRDNHVALDEAYYGQFGLVRGGVPQQTAHVAELLQACSELCVAVRPAGQGEGAIEVGCGASPYAPWLQTLGYTYLGVDLSIWATKWLHDVYGVATMQTDFMQLPKLDNCGLILAAHFLEHAENAPATCRKFLDTLKPGGQLVLVVPDDQDLSNPDHFWFFTEHSLTAMLEQVGFVEITAVTRRILAKEQFVYCFARKAF